jgi:cytochrome c biogenesis protein CcmG, thiol:disulfide interchange protein DsbE
MTAGTIATILAVAAMIAIIVYAVIARNAQVSGAAVSPVAFPSLPPPVKVGSQAPSFSVAAKGGTLSSDSLAGKPYLLEIFATWCPHCQRMTVILRDLQKKFPPSRLAIVSVSGSPVSSASTADKLVPEDQADIDAFDSTYHVTWPTAFDKDLTVAKAWGFAGYPGIFIVDKRGVIVFEHSGEIDEKSLVGALKKAGA